MVGSNDNAMMADFAQSLWNNYIKQKCEEENSNVISFYRARVTDNSLSSGGELRIVRPFDNEISVNCTSGMRGLSIDDEVVVARFGNGNASMNHLVFATVTGEMHTFESIKTVSYRSTAANTWAYTGSTVQLSTPGFIYMTSSWTSGRPTGLGLSNASTHDGPRILCFEEYCVQRTPIFYLGSGTYYIYEKRAVAAESANTIRVYRVWL